MSCCNSNGSLVLSNHSPKRFDGRLLELKPLNGFVIDYDPMLYEPYKRREDLAVVSAHKSVGVKNGRY